MVTDIKTILNSQLRTDPSRGFDRSNLSISLVDQLADELATEYDNQRFRSWYCGVIYQFGPSKVHEWRVRAKDANNPARLFSKYVKEAKAYSPSGGTKV